MSATATVCAARRVRVTMEGELQPIAVTDRHAILVRDDGAKTCIPLGTLSVLIEDVEVPRNWRDGDVVMNHVYGWTLTRFRGVWYIAGGDALALPQNVWDDADVNAGLTRSTDPYYGELRVLRYQAGEQ